MRKAVALIKHTSWMKISCLRTNTKGILWCWFRGFRTSLLQIKIFISPFLYLSFSFAFSDASGDYFALIMIIQHDHITAHLHGARIATVKETFEILFWTSQSLYGAWDCCILFLPKWENQVAPVALVILNMEQFSSPLPFCNSATAATSLWSKWELIFFLGSTYIHWELIIFRSNSTRILKVSYDSPSNRFHSSTYYIL